jgi:hypothetical protein
MHVAAHEHIAVEKDVSVLSRLATIGETAEGEKLPAAKGKEAPECRTASLLNASHGPLWGNPSCVILCAGFCIRPQLVKEDACLDECFPVFASAKSL